jgi:hypothetical protein
MRARRKAQGARPKEERQDAAYRRGVMSVIVDEA